MTKKKGKIVGLREETEGKLKRMVTKELGVSSNNVRSDSSWEDLGADSVDMVAFVMRAEEAYHLEISDEKISKINTFGKLVDYVYAKRMTRGDSPRYTA